MVTVKEVPADVFIEALARYLKENVPQVKPPEWALFVKTGPHKERIPDNPDWWYYRAASILRKLYISSEPIGLETFRTIYGGLQRRGSAPPHFRKASGSHIRKILQQLERAGLVVKIGNKGRTLSPRGRSLLDKLANEVFKDVVKVIPELKKYGIGGKGSE
ncbi:MAG: 30S ribosomal protein S19e [Desulfurococcales archaeon]|nr:30S ribosomal protein S19e [Desulfurococcales archaeon]